MKLLLQWVVSVSAFGAAGFWLWSASIYVPDFLQTKFKGPNSITGIMKLQSRLSAIAALCAGVSALAQAFATYKFPG